MTTIALGLYRGRSLLSRAIRFRTWSPYSHVSVIRIPESFELLTLPDRDELLLSAPMIDAWKGGVRLVHGVLAGHDKSTVVDIYLVIPSLRQALHAETLWTDALAHVGMPYDYLGVLGFLARSDRAHSDRRLFCSELASRVFARAGLSLLSASIPHHRVYPGMIPASPIIHRVHTLSPHRSP